MMNRRQFLVTSSAALGCAAMKLSAQTAKRPLGVQLYTVRKQAARDLPGVLAAIRKIGYEEVETYWDVYSRPAAELKRLLNDHGLRAPSGHFDYNRLEPKLEYAAELGVQYFVCPMLPEKMRNSADDFKRAADQFNRWGEKVRQAGMQFGFHNHNYEFHKFGDTTGWEVLIKGCDPKLVCLEMDCYWITQAGGDPMKMFQQYGDQIKLLHLKDRMPGYPTTQKLNHAAEHFTEVGAGTIDWKPILATAETYGVKHLFVERDAGVVPPLESLRLSFQNLQAVL